MIGSNLKRALTERISPHEAPVLSLYLDVNPAKPDNASKAYVLRAAEAVRGLDLEKEYIAALSERLSRDFARPQGRTLVIFAGADQDEFFESHYLQTRLPLLDRTDGVLAHWGEPFVAPLLYVLDQRERYAVIYVSEDRVRVFEAFLGQIEEVSDHAREVDTDSWQPYRLARRSPAEGMGVAARGGADVDRFRDRMREATARLYRTLLPELETSLESEGVDRVILSGGDAVVSAFQEAMGAGMRAKVVGQMPAPANPDAPANDWLSTIEELIDEVEARRELELLDRVRESGVWGVQETLTLLQDQGLRTVIVPWVLDKLVYRSESGRVAASQAEANVLNPVEAVSQVRLLEVLPGLAARSGAVIEFTDGEAEQRLLDEFGGMAGLKHA